MFTWHTILTEKKSVFSFSFLNKLAKNSTFLVFSVKMGCWGIKWTFLILANGCNETKSEKSKGVWILSIPTVYEVSKHVEGKYWTSYCYLIVACLIALSRRILIFLVEVLPASNSPHEMGQSETSVPEQSVHWAAQRKSCWPSSRRCAGRISSFSLYGGKNILGKAISS